MKLRILIACTVAAATTVLSGCVSFGQTDMLVTPFGVAGIHSFAPPPSPDNFKQLDRTAARLAAIQKEQEQEQAAN
jgi:hypothetical protein